jgi:hypothetical protein
MRYETAATHSAGKNLSIALYHYSTAHAKFNTEAEAITVQFCLVKVELQAFEQRAGTRQWWGPRGNCAITTTAVGYVLEAAENVVGMKTLRLRRSKSGDNSQQRVGATSAVCLQCTAYPVMRRARFFIDNDSLKCNTVCCERAT